MTTNREKGTTIPMTIFVIGKYKTFLMNVFMNFFLNVK